MRPIRRPLPGGLYEVSTRVTGNELLARPSEEVNDTILGVIGRAQTLYAVQLHAFVFASNHYHFLVSVPSSFVMSDFLQHVNGNIARKLNGINDRDGALWERRFHAIAVSPDAATSRWRLRYILAHGTKEGLVGKVQDWPGASSLPWLRDGTRIWGTWRNHTKRYYARRHKGYVDNPKDYEERYEVVLTVLPCWRHLPDATWRRLVRDMIAELNEEANERITETGRAPLGREAVLATDPFTRVHSKHGRAPRVFAVDLEVRTAMKEVIVTLTAMWREAAAAVVAALTGQPGAELPLPAMYWWALRM